MGSSLATLAAMRAHRRSIALVVLLAVAACDVGDGRTLDEPTFPLPATTLPADTIPPETAPPPELFLVAPWANGSPIPERYTCDGEDVSPALSWSNLPAGTMELAITVTDPDAGGFVHWIVSAITPETTGLVEGEVPGGAREWINDFGELGWNGPCPPAGPAHLYQFTVHALNQPLQLADDVPAAEVISTLNLIAIGQRSVSGTYARSG
jgi:Raf kinase inhibitor-like YbhB/YbcL family protein